MSDVKAESSSPGNPGTMNQPSGGLVGRAIVGMLAGFVISMVLNSIVATLMRWEEGPGGVVLIGTFAGAFLGAGAGNTQLGRQAERVAYGMLCGGAFGFVVAIVLSRFLAGPTDVTGSVAERYRFLAGVIAIPLGMLVGGTVLYFIRFRREKPVEEKASGRRIPYLILLTLLVLAILVGLMG